MEKKKIFDPILCKRSGDINRGTQSMISHKIVYTCLLIFQKNTLLSTVKTSDIQPLFRGTLGCHELVPCAPPITTNPSTILLAWCVVLPKRNTLQKTHVKGYKNWPNEDSQNDDSQNEDSQNEDSQNEDSQNTKWRENSQNST